MHFNPIRADHGFDHVRIVRAPRRLLRPTPERRGARPLPRLARTPRACRTGGSRCPTPTRPATAYDIATHPTTWVRDEALAFLAAARPDRPLLLVVSFPHPHPPVNPPEPYASMYDPADCVIDPDGASVNADLPLAVPAGDRAGRPPAPARRPGRPPAPPARRWPAPTVSITQVDDAMGRRARRLAPRRRPPVLHLRPRRLRRARGLVRKIPWIPFDDLARVPLLRRRRASWPVVGSVAEPCSPSTWPRRSLDWPGSTSTWTCSTASTWPSPSPTRPPHSPTTGGPQRRLHGVADGAPRDAQVHPRARVGRPRALRRGPRPGRAVERDVARRRPDHHRRALRRGRSPARRRTAGSPGSRDRCSRGPPGYITNQRPGIVAAGAVAAAILPATHATSPLSPNAGSAAWTEDRLQDSQGQGRKLEPLGFRDVANGILVPRTAWAYRSRTAQRRGLPWRWRLLSVSGRGGRSSWP